MVIKLYKSKLIEGNRGDRFGPGGFPSKVQIFSFFLVYTLFSVGVECHVAIVECAEAGHHEAALPIHMRIRMPIPTPCPQSHPLSHHQRQLQIMVRFYFLALDKRQFQVSKRLLRCRKTQ